MVIQIAKPETIHLIETVSRITGESADTAVAVALRERLERLGGAEDEARRRAEVRALAKRLADLVKESEMHVADPGELLFDEDGLPR